MRTSSLVLLAVATALAPGFACSPAAPKPASGVGVHAPSVSAVPTVGKPAAPPSVPGVVLGAFPEGTFGPRVVRRHDGKRAIVVSAPKGTAGRRWIAQGLDDDDKPLADQKHEVAEAPEDSSAWDVKAVGDGFVLAWTKPADGGEQLFVVALSGDGTPRGTPAAAYKTTDDIVAVRLVSLGGANGQGLLTFGEKSNSKAGGAASGALLVIGLDGSGKPFTSATRVETGLSAWQIGSLPGGATARNTAVVTYVQRDDAKKAALPPKKKGKNDPEPGKGEPKGADVKQAAPDVDTGRSAYVVSLTLTGKGNVDLSPAAPLALGSANPEVDLVLTSETRGLCLFADRREGDAHLFSTTLDLSTGKPVVGKVKRAVPARGDQSIVGMVPSKDGAFVLYETHHPKPLRELRRRFDLARLSADGEALGTPRGFFYPYEEDEPELARVSDDEVAVLTYGDACSAIGEAAPTCPEKRDIRPFIVRFGGPVLAEKQADLLDHEGTGGAVHHAFDLSCAGGRCDALLEGPNNPTTVVLARIGMHPPVSGNATRWVFREASEPVTGPPRLEGASSVGRETQFTGLHAVRAGAGSLVGWITWAPEDGDSIAQPKGKGDKKDDKPKKDGKELGARVVVRLLDGTGTPVGPTSLISERGLPKGDVAVAWTGEGDKASGVVAYASRAEGDEEIYVARLDSKGQKLGNSARITSAKGSASDVAVSSLPEGGYLLAWVDGRKEDQPAVYAVRLDKDGKKQGSEVKVGGGAGGDVTDLAIATVGNQEGGRILLAWSDARRDAAHGFADPFFTIVSAKDLKTVVSERSLVETKTHSHALTVAARGDGGAIVGWLEDDPSSTEMLEYDGKAGWGAFVARVDAGGFVVQAPGLVPIDPSVGHGVPTNIVADCSGACRLLLGFADKEGVAVLGSTVVPAGGSPARLVWSFRGPSTQELSPALLGNVAFLCEDGWEKDDGRVRRLSLSW
ncbi:MAG: hypothetical protein IPJ34_15440 [Myxococcales bacterium]|nr:hypothetical protein [Myxococcales bacterium]